MATFLLLIGVIGVGAAHLWLEARGARHLAARIRPYVEMGRRQAKRR